MAMKTFGGPSRGSSGTLLVLVQCISMGFYWSFFWRSLVARGALRTTITGDRGDDLQRVNV